MFVAAVGSAVPLVYHTEHITVMIFFYLHDTRGATVEQKRYKQDQVV